jgi:hypothetical protein
LETEMKGLSLRNYVGVLRELRGDAVAEAVLAALRPELRAALTSGQIVPSGWYPVGWKRELHAAGKQVTAEPRLAWVMGSEMTRRDLKGIYRSFLRVVSPRYVMSVGSRFFANYFRGASMRVHETRRGFTRVSFAGCHGFDRNLWLDVVGGCEATLEAAGGQYVRMHIEAGGRDGDHAAQVSAWWSRDPEDARDDASVGIE